jgi:FkbM family methyltransferase
MVTIPVTTIAFFQGAKRREFHLDLNPITDRFILDFIEAGSFYEPDISNALLRMLRPGDTVVDVGANLGFFTILMGVLVGPAGRVFSLEPGDDNLPRLRDNIARNRLENVSVIPRPASAQAGSVAFFTNSDGAGGHALWDPGTFPGNVRSREKRVSRTLNATTLDDVLDGASAPRVMKIDTEGAEHLVLSGARRLLERRAVPFIIAELHPFGLEKMGSSPHQLRQYMAEHGYETFGLYFDGSLPKLIPRGTEIEMPHILNLLFSTPQDVASVWPVEHFDPRRP